MSRSEVGSTKVRTVRAAGPPVVAPHRSRPDVSGPPAAVLAMQRTAGNAATAGVLGARGLVTVARAPEGDDGVGGPGTEYTPVKVVKKGKRVSFEVALHLKRSAGGGKVDGRLLKTSAEGIGGTLGAALGEVTLEVGELMPGVKFEIDVGALEATVSGDDIDVSLMKIQAGVTGALSKDIASTAFGKRIMAGPMGPALRAGWAIEIEGKFQIELAPEDAARIARMAKASRQMAENGAELVKAADTHKRLLQEQTRLRQLERTRGAKLSPAKRKQLAERIRKNADKLKKVSAAVAERVKVNGKLLDEAKVAMKGLKSKMGRTIGKGVAKLGGKLLAKLVPGLNVITTAMDIIELGGFFYKLAKGEVEIGLGGGGDEGGSKDRTGGGGDADALPPEVDVTDALDTSDLDEMGVGGGGGKDGADGPPPVLHPAAEAITRALRDTAGVRLTPRDLAQLGDIIPTDLSGTELAAVIAMLKGPGAKAESPFAAIGAVIEAVRTVRAAPGGTTVTGGDSGAGGESGDEFTFDEGLDLSGPEGGGTTPGEAPAERPELIPFLEAAKQAMGAREIWGSFEPLPRSAMKPGAVIEATIAIRGPHGIVGGTTTLVLKKGPAADGTWEATMMPMTVYDEAGQRLGALPSSTGGGWRIPVKDAARSGAKAKVTAGAR